MPSLAIIESILRDRPAFFCGIRQRPELSQKIRSMLMSSVTFLSLYGAAMGSQSSFWQPAARRSSCLCYSWPRSSCVH
jgi:hypothetical protein